MAAIRKGKKGDLMNNLAPNQPRKIILVSIPMFLGSRNSMVTFKNYFMYKKAKKLQIFREKRDFLPVFRQNVTNM